MVRILIVEDEVIVAQHLAHRLRELGYEVVATVTRGEDAVREVQSWCPDLVLMDIRLAGEIDGVTAAEQIRSYGDIPVIYLTGYADPATLQRAKVTGPFGYVLKPFELQELHTAIEMALYKHGVEQELRRYREHLEELVQERTVALAQEVAERRRAEEESRRRAEELGTLNDMSRRIGGSHSLAQVVSIALDGVASSICPDLVVLYLRQGNDLLLQGIYPPEAESAYRTARSKRMGECLCGLAAVAGRPLYSGDILMDPRCTCDECKAAGMRSFAALPLLKGNETLGVLGVASARPDDLREQTSFFETLVSDIAVGLQNVLLLEAMRRHAEGLEEAVAQRTRELQVERDRTRAILEAVGEAVLVTDVAGHILYINQAAVALSGYGKAEALGQYAPSWFAASLTGGPRAAIEEALQAGRHWHGELTGLRRDGTVYDAAVTLAPLADPEAPDQLLGTVCAQRDITPLKEAERLKDRFVSNVSHELRTPLSIITLISGNLETLYDMLDDARRCKMIHDLREQARILDSLIGNVLEVSRLDSGRVSLERRRVNLVGLLREEVGKQQPLAEKKSLVLRVFAPRSLTVWANADQLRQVVRNLVNNAIKYTPEGGPIVCECRPHDVESDWGPDWPGSADLPAGRWAGLRVVDTGIGIAPQELPHIFERFYRVQLQSSMPGTGLGLAIARELVELHGGHIAAASSPGKGCTFAIYLPLTGRSRPPQTKNRP